MAKEIKLGHKCKDVVTGFTGIVTARTQYLTGCDRVMLTPEVNKDGKVDESMSFDITSVEFIDE